MITVTAQVDEKAYGLLCRKDQAQEVMHALGAIYCIVWGEACYDPYNEHTQKLAEQILPHIQKLNTILEFKK